MNKRMLRSFALTALMTVVFGSSVLAEGTSTTTTTAASAEQQSQTEMSVISVKLPVYESFEDLSDYKRHLAPDYERYAELSLNDRVTVLKERDYAAEIKMADGRIGWVHKDYLKKDLMSQTWLLKEWRNVRKSPTSTEFIGKLDNNSRVYVLDFDPETNYYKIQTADGQLEGWIYGLYLENEKTKLDEGSNVIPYEFDTAGTVTNKISIFTPLNTEANITANEINAFITYKTGNEQTFMTGMGSAYIEAQNVAGLNAVYLLAHSGLETNWGRSDIVKEKNNFYGIGAVDFNPAEGAVDFTAASNGIIAGASWINVNYVSRSFPYQQPTLDNMRFNSAFHQYSTDEAWASKIAFIAKEFYDYTFKNGEELKTGWYRDGQNSYYFDAQGRMLTGKQTIDGRNYTFSLNGYLNLGWQQDGGKRYYLKQDRTYQTGWFLDAGKWYYFDQSGIMQTGWKLVNNKWYFLTQTGEMKTGWMLDRGKWYFLDQTNGDMKIGWLYTGGKWYFLDQTNGDMKTGWLYNGGKWYFLDQTNGDMKIGWVYTGGQWYYLNSSGAMQTGWVYVGGSWYYLYGDGHMASNTWIGKYRLGSDGAML